ncbi:protein of unknown function [Caballeronia sp. S22]
MALFNPKNEQNPRNSFGQSEDNCAFDDLVDEFRFPHPGLSRFHPGLSRFRRRTKNENQA